MCTMSYAQCCWMCMDSIRNYAIENLISIINDVRSKQTHKTRIPMMKLKQTNVRWSVMLVRLKGRLNILDGFSKNTQISNFMDIRTVGAELFDADGQT